MISERGETPPSTEGSERNLRKPSEVYNRTGSGFHFPDVQDRCPMKHLSDHKGGMYRIRHPKLRATFQPDRTDPVNGQTLIEEDLRLLNRYGTGYSNQMIHETACFFKNERKTAYFLTTF